MTIKPTYEELEQKVKELENESFERKKAEAVLKEKELKLRMSERALKSILTNSPDIIYRLDQEGTITYVNDTVREYGYSREDLIGKNLLEFIHPDDREKAVHRINERRTGDRSTKSLEIRLLRKDLAYAHFEDKSKGFEVLLIDAEGIYSSEDPKMNSFVGTQGIARDIFERKQAQEALRESEEKFSGFAKASGYGFAIGKLSGQLVFGNSACLRIVEEEREADFTAKTFYQYYSEEDKKLLIEDILPTVMAKGQWKGELSLLSAKGNLTPIEQNIFLISDKHGNPQLVGNIITDITSRKEAEEALQESEERYRALFERSLELVYLCDFEGNFIDANDIALKSIGYTKKDIKSLNFSSLLVEDPSCH